MIKTEIHLDPVAQLKLELYREFDDDAEKVFDFITKKEPIFVTPSKNADDCIAHASQSAPIVSAKNNDTPDGVYIIYNDGRAEVFNGNNPTEDVAYIGVKLGSKAIAVALNDLGGRKEYQFIKDGASSEEECDRYTKTRKINAFEDFDGVANTERLKTLETEIPLSELKDGEYIPALGEIGLIMMHLSKVNEALEHVGGTPLKGWYWSSTEYSQYSAWGVSFSDGGTYSSNKYYSGYVRAVAAF